MIPRFPPTRSMRECATPTIPDRHKHTQAPAEPAHNGEARLIQLPTPRTTTPETDTPVSDALTPHLDTSLDRSRAGLRPISTRNRTDLGTGYDRSRAGLRPISAEFGRSPNHPQPALPPDLTRPDQAQTAPADPAETTSPPASREAGGDASMLHSVTAGAGPRPVRGARRTA